MVLGGLTQGERDAYGLIGESPWGRGRAAQGGALALVGSGLPAEAYSEPDIALSPRINLGGQWPCLKLPSFFPSRHFFAPGYWPF